MVHGCNDARPGGEPNGAIPDRSGDGRSGRAGVLRRVATRCRASILALGGLAAGLSAQAPTPAQPNVESSATARLLIEGWELIDVERLLAARQCFRQVQAFSPDSFEGLLGLGEAHLQLGRPQLAVHYARAARQCDQSSGRAAALHVRALIRSRQFLRAAELSGAVVADLGGVDVWAAHGSALFRLQRIDAAAEAYRRVLALDPLHAEAHLRLGSGLTAPVRFEVTPELERGVEAMRGGDDTRAVRWLRAALSASPDDPVAHRLLGEALLRQKAARGLVATAPEYRALREALPSPPPPGPGIDKFVPAYAELSAARRESVERALALFAPYVSKLVTLGGRHDFLLELERTTDAIDRASLRGRRTFDGRVWDDVRGMGGLRAATGIEALDDPLEFGFDTFAHELAHQAHLFAFSRLDRQRIRQAYRSARQRDGFLDYYAASNDAEYFGQGVEAFVSFGKRPGREPTHGHTRFELYRKDRELHDLIADLVSYDPLRDPQTRAPILRAAIDVALLTGRAEDAVVAAEMMAPGPERERALARARTAEQLERSY